MMARVLILVRAGVASSARPSGSIAGSATSSKAFEAGGESSGSMMAR